jgi:uncharacterized protein
MMIRTYTVIGGLLLSGLFLSSQALAHPNHKLASSQTGVVAKSIAPAQQKALQQAIASYIKQRGVTPDASHRFFADTIDLNGDGVLDALVVFSSSYWCGTGGCTMLVFKGKTDKTFQLVSESSLVRPPVTVSETKTKGWRDLIIQVSGGGAPAKTVALKFDGKKYPLNPSDQPGLPDKPPVKGTVLFPQGSEPQTLKGGAAAQKPSGQTAKPSFDCAKAQGAVETLICKDTELAALDQKLDGVYRTALQKAEQFPPRDLANFKAEQNSWIKRRNDCGKAPGNTVQNCVKENYRDRTAELQAMFALVPGQKPVFYTCNNNPANEIVATFYKTNPPTARLERGDTVITAFLRPSGSGAKYERQNVLFWSKGKAALVQWKDEKLQCQAK